MKNQLFLILFLLPLSGIAQVTCLSNIYVTLDASCTYVVTDTSALLSGDPGPGGYGQYIFDVVNDDVPGNGLSIEGVGTFFFSVEAVTPPDSLICFGNITTEDKTIPSVGCRANYEVFLDASGQATVIPDSLVSSSSDNCGIASFSLSQSIFTCSDVGSNQVQVTATDQGGNTATCFATVEVRDTISPDVFCLGSIAVDLNASGQATIQPSDLDGGSTDACGVTLFLDKSDFTCLDVGVATTVTLLAMDPSGNQDFCFASVTVNDPTSYCASNLVIDQDSGQGYSSFEDAVAGAGDTSTLVINTQQMLGNLEPPADASMTLVAPEGATVQVDSLTTSGGEVQLTGSMMIEAVTLGTGTVSTNGQVQVGTISGTVDSLIISSDTVRVDSLNITGEVVIEPGAVLIVGDLVSTSGDQVNLRSAAVPRTILNGDVMATNVELDGGMVEVRNGTLHAENVIGGGPGSFIALYNGNAGFSRPSAPDGQLFFPIGYRGAGENATDEYSPVLIQENTILRTQSNAERIEIRLPGAGQNLALFPDAAALQNGIPAGKSHLDYVFDITAYDESDSPISNYPLSELYLYFFNSQAVEPEVLAANPVVVHQGSAGASYYLGEGTVDQSLAEGRMITVSGSIGVHASNVVIGSPVTVLGCEACGEGSVWVCSPGDSPGQVARSQCIEERELIQYLNAGSYCGQCQESNELPAFPQWALVLFGLLVLSAGIFFLQRSGSLKE